MQWGPTATPWASTGAAHHITPNFRFSENETKDREQKSRHRPNEGTKRRKAPVGLGHICLGGPRAKLDVRKSTVKSLPPRSTDLGGMDHVSMHLRPPTPSRWLIVFVRSRDWTCDESMVISTSVVAGFPQSRPRRDQLLAKRLACASQRTFPEP